MYSENDNLLALTCREKCVCVCVCVCVWRGGWGEGGGNLGNLPPLKS